MRSNPRRTRLATALLLACVATASAAAPAQDDAALDLKADEPEKPAAKRSTGLDDAGALGLQSDDPEKRPATSSQTKLFVEGAAGYADRRYGLGAREVSRAAIDLRTSFPLSPSVRGTFSGRIDVTQPAEPRLDGPIASVREAYLGWQNEAATQVVDIGRINVRQGPGYGYNPTDFFRDHALRTLTTADPFQLRENRMGSVMLRAQRLWTGGSVEVVYSPELAASRSTKGVSFDLGSTNARDRGMVVLNSRWSETLNSQLSLYREAGTPMRLGVSGTALLSQSLVAHGELASSRETSLLSRALGRPGPRRTDQRVVAGLTYTTPSQLSLTVEYEGNGFAVARANSHAIQQAGPQVWSAYYLQALSLQETASRHAALLYATQRDLGLKNLDLTVILRANVTDKSRMTWIDLKYRLDKLDLALQYQHNGGPLGTEFGSAINRQLTSIVATLYF